MSSCPLGLVADGNMPPGGVAGIAAQEAQRRQAQVEAAQTLFTAGSRAYADGSFGEAMDNFKAAFETVPAVPAVEEQRRAFFRRYQAASLAFTKVKIEEARWAEAEQTLETVMTTARDHDLPVAWIDPEVRQILGDLKSFDERYDMAATPQHLSEVDAVEKQLILGKGYLELGDYDRAERAYQRALLTDPYSSAARRGLEKVERHRMDYYDAAYDHARARQLAEVKGAWEMPVPVLNLGTDTIDLPGETATAGSATLERKLREIVIPRIEFANARLVDVLEFLSQKSQELDTAEADPAKKGVNIVVDSSGSPDADALAQRPLTVRLSNIPLGEALRYVTGLVDMKYRVESFAVMVVPQSVATDAGFATRTFPVPPGFISAKNQGAGGGAEPNDPFADPPEAGAGSGITIQRLTAREFLENNGIVFAEGASAKFIPATSTLVVRNTPEQLIAVENLVRSAREGGSKMVKINVKMITIEQTNLKQLGLDWLLGASNIGNPARVFFSGGTDGNSTTPTDAADYPFSRGGIPVGMNPVTGGLRMGDLSTTQSLIDVINRENPSSGSTKAPGVFSLAGVFTDPQFQVVLRALNQSKGADVLSDNHVLVKPGQIAAIEQIREFIYPTEYDPPEIPNQFGVPPFGPSSEVPATPATPTAFEMRRLGNVVEVEPTVSGDNLTVNVNVTADFSDFVGFINYGTPIRNGNFIQADGASPVVTENRILMPVFDAVKETTNVTVWDGQTIAIGGLHGESVTSAEDKIPLLGDIPGVGRAFRSRTSDATKRAMVIFVTVLLVDPGGNPINAPPEDPELITRQDVPPVRDVVPMGPPPAGIYPAK